MKKLASVPNGPPFTHAGPGNEPLRRTPSGNSPPFGVPITKICMKSKAGRRGKSDRCIRRGRRLCRFKRELIPSIEGIPELGWALATPAHGKGFATEAVRTALRWGDEHLERSQTVCIIAPDNVASIHVAEKCGYQECSIRRISTSRRFFTPESRRGQFEFAKRRPVIAVITAAVLVEALIASSSRCLRLIDDARETLARAGNRAPNRAARNRTTTTRRGAAAVPASFRA